MIPRSRRRAGRHRSRRLRKRRWRLPTTSRSGRTAETLTARTVQMGRTVSHPRRRSASSAADTGSHSPTVTAGACPLTSWTAAREARDPKATRATRATRVRRARRAIRARTALPSSRLSARKGLSAGRTTRGWSIPGRGPLWGLREQAWRSRDRSSTLRTCRQPALPTERCGRSGWSIPLKHTGGTGQHG